MKSIGRIFEVHTNMFNFSYANKYVIVYENKDFFVCKEFGSTYPRIISKRDCYEYPNQPKINNNFCTVYIVDREHKMDVSIAHIDMFDNELNKLKQQLANIEKSIKYSENNVERCKREIVDSTENIESSRKKMRDLTQRIEELINKQKDNMKEFESFGEE